MKVGIAGLGLIGGSLAKAYKGAESMENTVYGHDADPSVLAIAQISGAVDAPLDPSTVGQCDCILIAVYPNAAVSYLEQIAPYVSKDAVVIDCCGVNLRRRPPDGRHPQFRL
jgi:prephenate dehydrogenase